MKYKEPKKQGVKLSLFWISTITTALSKQHGVTIERGDCWAVNPQTKTLKYTDDISYLDKDNLLAILLHEIGHLKYSTWLKEDTAIYKKYGEASQNVVNAVEDTRVDYLMGLEYENSYTLLDALHVQSLNHGIIKLKEYDEYMRVYLERMRLYEKGIIDAQVQFKAGRVSESQFQEWIMLNQPMKVQHISPVTEVMYMMLTMYHGFGDSSVISNYYNQDYVDRARQCLALQYAHNPEHMQNIHEVQDYWETYLFPIIEPIIEKNKDGSEKKNNRGHGAQQMQVGIQKSAELKEKADKAKQEALKKQGTKAGNDEPIPEVVDYNRYYKTITGMVTTSSSRFARVLKDNKFDRFAGRFRSGELNKKRLFKYKTQDYRLFQRKTERKNKDYAFSLMLDCSGSMSGKSIEESMKGIVLMSEVLNRCNVPYEVMFFSSRHTVGKGFGEKLSRNKIGQQAEKVWSGGTQIVKPFMEALGSLKARKERHKIMVILTDGEIEGNGESELRKAMSKAEDISYYGIGLGVDLKSIFKDNAINIKEVSEIVPKFTAILKRHIKIG